MNRVPFGHVRNDACFLNAHKHECNGHDEKKEDHQDEPRSYNLDDHDNTRSEERHYRKRDRNQCMNSFIVP